MVLPRQGDQPSVGYRLLHPSLIQLIQDPWGQQHLLAPRIKTGSIASWTQTIYQAMATPPFPLSSLVWSKELSTHSLPLGGHLIK